MKLYLLHGALGASVQLENLKQHLASVYNVHTINFSGHGGKNPGKEFSIKSFAGDVLDAMEKEGDQKINILGYSMGGYVGLYLCLHHPEKINKLMTLSTKMEWTPEVAAREVKMLDPDKIESKVPAFALHLQQLHQPIDWKEVVQKTAAMMTQMGNQPPVPYECLSEIQHEVKMVVGDRDTMVSAEETIKAFRNLPNGELSILPQTPHPIEKISPEKIRWEATNFF